MSSVSTVPTSQLPAPAEASPRAEARDAALDDDDELRPRALVVAIGGQHYGIPVGQAREVVRAARLTRIPGAPAEVLGVVNVRGAVVTVLDPMVILQGRRAVTLSSIVLVQNGTRLVGFAVEAVRDVRLLDANADAARAGGTVTPLDAAALCARYLISAEEMGR